MKIEVFIPSPVAEQLLQIADETGLPLEDIVESALKNYLERSSEKNG